MAKAKQVVITRYRLEVSLHTQDEIIRDKDDPTKFTRGGSINYKAGDVFDSDQDLLTLNGPGGMAPKFTKVSSSTRLVGGTRAGEPIGDLSKPAEPAKELPGNDTYQAMTVSELKAFASEEEIDLKGAKTKEEIIKALNAAAQAL